METPEIDGGTGANPEPLNYLDQPEIYPLEYAESGGEKYSGVHFLVHPGWAVKNYDLDWEEEDRKDKFLKKFYLDYISDIQEMLNGLGKDELLHVIHEEGGRSHAETMIDQLADEQPEVRYTRSLDGVGEVPEENLPEISESLDSLKPGGRLTLNGEICGRCDRRFRLQVEELVPAHTEMQKGETFPPEPTWNYVFP